MLIGWKTVGVQGEGKGSEGGSHSISYSSLFLVLSPLLSLLCVERRKACCLRMERERRLGTPSFGQSEQRRKAEIAKCFALSLSLPLPLSVLSPLLPYFHFIYVVSYLFISFT